MKMTPRSPIFLFLIIFLSAMLFMLMRPKEKPAAPTRTDAVDTSHDQELEKFNLTGFDEKGKKFWNLEGDSARIDIGETVFLEDNVTLRLRDVTVIKTDKVQWSQNNSVLKTNSVVNVTHQQTKVKGKGAYGRLNEGFIQLNRDIVMDINPTARLTCEGPMKLFYNDNKMTFYRKVIVTDLKGTLMSNRMDVFFDNEQKRIKEIVAMGNVVIVRGSDTTKSARAIYNTVTGSVRLEGSPEINLHKDSSDLLNAPFAN